MISFHKEGKATILLGLIISATAYVLSNYVFEASSLWKIVIGVLSLVLMIIILQFFRNPKRPLSKRDNSTVMSPADGEVVVIEEVFEDEYFNEKKIQVSIFMSPINVHVNRNPITGIISYFKYHPGKFLFAWNPKSSTENERSTYVYKDVDTGVEILMRQIAGFLARRIVCYPRTDHRVAQGDDMGFIKFGSRVDLLLPLDADINVVLNQKVKGNRTIIAKI